MENLGNDHSFAHAKYGANRIYEQHFDGRNTFWFFFENLLGGDAFGSYRRKKGTQILEASAKWNMQNMKIYNINYLINGLINYLINYSINYLINYLIEKRVRRKHLSHMRAKGPKRPGPRAGPNACVTNAWNELFF